jgi:1,4-dihydroxy-2-naphthoate octaprenyltransferase
MTLDDGKHTIIAGTYLEKEVGGKILLGAIVAWVGLAVLIVIGLLFPPLLILLLLLFAAYCIRRARQSGKRHTAGFKP